MNRALELFESRVDRLSVEAGVVRVHFSHGYVHQSRGKPGSDPGTAWSQELALVLHGAHVKNDGVRLPDDIVGGWLEAGGERYELVPLPFRRPGAATVHLELRRGAVLDVVGRSASVEALDAPIFLEELS
jgi:hypothetical protein